MSKKLMLIGLAMIIALGTLFVAACGDDDSDGANAELAMQQALDVIEADMQSLEDQMMAGGTGADVKAAVASVEGHWQAVVDACDGLDGADAAKAQKLFDDVEAAVNGLADDADLTAIAVAVLGPVGDLQTYVAELRDLVGASPTTEGAAEGESDGEDM